MSLPLASINTNYTSLASSPSTRVKGTESTIDTNVKAAIATDATLGKKKLYTNFIYNEFTFTYASSYIEKKWKEMSKNIVLTYSDIWIYINTCNTYMICHQKAKYDL